MSGIVMINNEDTSLPLFILTPHLKFIQGFVEQLAPCMCQWSPGYGVHSLQLDSSFCFIWYLPALASDLQPGLHVSECTRVNELSTPDAITETFWLALLLGYHMYSLLRYIYLPGTYGTAWSNPSRPLDSALVPVSVTKNQNISPNIFLTEIPSSLPP